MNILSILNTILFMHNMFMEKFSNEKFGERLRLVRNMRGYTLQNMADSLYIGLRSYQNYEAGDRFPSPTVLRAIAQKLNVSIDYLLWLTDEEPVDE
ncbi:helix-turn-helix domain-containing protein [Eggerthellaceae bacterium zg-893]|nr:helix-turn-helix domain-containing protein [Eggerthellaceae bacterium zg-893]